MVVLPEANLGTDLVDLILHKLLTTEEMDIASGTQATICHPYDQRNNNNNNDRLTAFDPGQPG